MNQLSFVQKNCLICLMTATGFTWLNPHVWVDMIMIVGSTAQSTPDLMRIYFLAGVTIASIIWFLGIGYGARFLRPVFQNPLAWRVMDFLTALMMIGIAIKLTLEIIPL